MAGVRYVDFANGATLLCIAEDGHWYRYQNDNAIWSWSEPQGEAVVIAGGMGEVYWVDQQGRLHYRRDNDPAPRPSLEALPDVPLSMTVDSEGALWVVGRDGTLMRRKQGAWRQTRVSDARLVEARDALNIYYVNQAGQLFRYDPGSTGAPGQPVELLPGLSVQSFSVGLNGDMWIADAQDNLYQRVGGSMLWKRNNNGLARQVAVGQWEVQGSQVACVNRDGQLWISSEPHLGVDTHWAQIPGPGGAPVTVAVAVQHGDTLGELVDKHCPDLSSSKRDAMIWQIVAMNGLASPDQIYAGTTLTFPACP